MPSLARHFSGLISSEILKPKGIPYSQNDSSDWLPLSKGSSTSARLPLWRVALPTPPQPTPPQVVTIKKCLQIFSNDQGGKLPPTTLNRPGMKMGFEPAVFNFFFHSGQLKSLVSQTGIWGCQVCVDLWVLRAVVHSTMLRSSLSYQLMSRHED